MKNRFAHEIEMGKYFLGELESYLERDEAKELEEMTERYYTLGQENEDQIKGLKQELEDARMKVAKIAMEKGRLLKRIEHLESIKNINSECMGEEVEPDPTGRP